MFFPFVDELTFYHVERLGDALVEVCRDYRAWLHYDVQHHRPKRVILVADSEGDVSFARERKPIGLDLRGGNFLIVHVVLLFLSLDEPLCLVIPDELSENRRRQRITRSSIFLLPG